MKNHLYPIIILLFIAGLARYFYFVNGPDLFISADTYGYYETGQKLANEGIPVNDSRPPQTDVRIRLFSLACFSAI
ncbi:MAG: hypothetical protein UV46_C0021G0019 [Candidatus Gottesmanbacteria bacterium GW2011_GWC2_42_8]|nr:MAG: hypothetical protein UV46_C0021G0019 [Candidatus Gottesmanbacteria bacterium GW2011_GWC2_42_8]